ncbi:MAG: hypothetical protein Q8J85_07075 [Sulfuricurvum sp.]|nr:hypothetical protein [Sulfuricurvum sp.]MDP3023012.1 hypothetical protein [Sulfuricurvum sp.]
MENVKELSVLLYLRDIKRVSFDIVKSIDEDRREIMMFNNNGINLKYYELVKKQIMKFLDVEKVLFKTVSDKCVIIRY